MKSFAVEYRQCQLVQRPEPLAGVDGLVDDAVGRFRRRSKVVESLRREAGAIDAKAEDWSFHSDLALQRHLLEFRDRFQRQGRDAELALPDALAAIREAAS